MSLVRALCAAARAALFAVPARADAADAPDAACKRPVPSHDPLTGVLAPAAERASKGGGLLSPEPHAAAPAPCEPAWRGANRSGGRRVDLLDL